MLPQGQRFEKRDRVPCTAIQVTSLEFVSEEVSPSLSVRNSSERSASCSLVPRLSTVFLMLPRH